MFRSCLDHHVDGLRGVASLMQRACHPSPNWYISNTVPAPKAQGSLQKRGREGYKSQRNRAFVVRWCLLEMPDKGDFKHGRPC